MTDPQWTVHESDCLDVLRGMADASVDAVVTDPPYELGFMGKAWDASGIAYRVDLWRDVLRVLKPGGHMLAFGGTRTYHRMACAIEDAGFEVRDSIHWLYGQGFPKSLDVSKAIDKAAGAERQVIGENPNARPNRVGARSVALAQRQTAGGPLTSAATPAARQWHGWGTALKPAHEPIVLARKPFAGTVAANVQAYGTGGLNIGGCRVEGTPGRPGNKRDSTEAVYSRSMAGPKRRLRASYTARVDAGEITGRWPANVVLACCGESPCVPGCPVAELDAQSGTLRNGGQNATSNRKSVSLSHSEYASGEPTHYAGDIGGASRFFFCAKAKGTERDAGCEGLTPTVTQDGRSKAIDNPYLRGETKRLNSHPTVKPVALMRWLCRLVTPPRGIVLDPFAGSGTTGVAAVAEGMRFIGIEREPEYVAIARKRLGVVS